MSVFLRRHIARLFTNDDELLEIVLPLLILGSFDFFAEGLQGYLAGPIRGLGLQKTASIIAIVCYCFVGLPFAAVSAFKYDFGVYGIMGGILAACSL